MDLQGLRLTEPELLFWGPGTNGEFLVDVIDWAGATGVDFCGPDNRQEAMDYWLMRGGTVYTFSFDAIAVARTDEATHMLARTGGGAEPEPEIFESLNSVLWRATGDSEFKAFVLRGDPAGPTVGCDPQHYQLRLSHDVFDVLTCEDVQLSAMGNASP